MKANKYSLLPIALGVMTACSDFGSINTDPTAANEEQIRVEYAINQSITEAQQNPEVAERCFVLNWMDAARYLDPNTGGGLTVGRHKDDWLANYYGHYSQWMSAITLAINTADSKMKGELTPHERLSIPNMKQVARIWRVYLISEFTDSFGVFPIASFQGQNPMFDSTKDVYYYMLKELKEASEAIDPKVEAKAEEKRCDRAYQFDYGNWIRYANSMRMRLAMRLSEVDPTKAKSEFEAAVQGMNIITEAKYNLSIKEDKGWTALTGVLTREWNAMALSASVNNLMLGLGGIPSAELLKNASEQIRKKIKPEDYMGVYLEQHYTLQTDEPRRGFWFDGIPYSIDPRAYQLYMIPGDTTNARYCRYPSWNKKYSELRRKLLKDKNDTEGMELDATYTWSTAAPGSWGEKGGLNNHYDWAWSIPRLALDYRDSSNSRIFFASWESYFLIAEAALRGWTTPLTGKEAYELGIRHSFAYHHLESYVEQYLASETYNNVGTSVKWEHTEEPPATKSMSMVDGYTKEKKAYTYHYPVASQTLYGKSLNDQLTKIITQKYLANMPWLPLEAWNDRRRLGLPFFEVPASEEPIVTMPALKVGQFSPQQLTFYPQRMKFPSTLESNNPRGYKHAVDSYLAGKDEVLTPLWWAKK